MTIPVTFQSLAKKELDMAAEYYSGKSPGLGKSFLNEIEHSLRQIVDFPESAPILVPPLRIMLLRKFPYGLIYSKESQGIRVFAVAHRKRHPFYWIDRV